MFYKKEKKTSSVMLFLLFVKKFVQVYKFLTVYFFVVVWHLKKTENKKEEEKTTEVYNKTFYYL